MNENKNPNLPANAVRCVDVRPGKVLRVANHDELVVEVKWYGFEGKVVTDLGTIRVNRAGTLRLA